MERAKRELGVTFLNLDWVDSTSFEISDESLCECCRFIHSARTGGGSVLVHCAQVCPLPHTLHSLTYTHSLSLQGKSRSTTAVVAHSMASCGLTYTQALSAVQAKRKMAEPNPTFQQRLKSFEKSHTLASLRADLHCD